MADERTAHGIVAHFPKTSCFKCVHAVDVDAFSEYKVAVGLHPHASMTSRDVLLHDGVTESDIRTLGHHLLADVWERIDADVLDGAEAIVTCPDEVVANLHLLDVNRNIEFAVEHFLDCFGKLDVVLVV